METDQIPASFVTLAEGTTASDYALKELSKALGQAQNEFGHASKSEKNAYVGYQYVPLEQIIAAARPSLTKYHLTVSQFPVVDLESKMVTLYTRVVHWDSGEWMQNAIDVPAELALGKDGAPKFNQQTIGGSQTYAQKYAYKAILGIPDSEEMVDSTEEKGDLPARTKSPQRGQPQRTAPDDPQAAAQAPTGIRSQFFSKAKEYGWGLGELKKFVLMAYPDAKGSTANLTEEQLEQALVVMSDNKPEDVLKA